MKQQIIEQILKHLTQELEQLAAAAKAAHSAATDDQSIAETQYDTLAIEASYLAQGQSLRVKQLQQALTAIQNMPIESSPVVTLGALVQLYQQQQHKQWLFIAPAAAGFQCEIGSEKITVITPQSPMAKALMGHEINDDIELTLGHQAVVDQIITIE